MGELWGKIRTHRETTFWCAVCHGATDFYPTVRERQRDIIKNARRLGWRNRAAGWTCPQCSQDRRR